MIERHHIESRNQWLALRKRDVTASVVAACFGAHPYTSQLKLWREKSGYETDEDVDNPILRRGRWFEGAVAIAVGEAKPEWEIAKAIDYYRDNVARIGATPDFFIRDRMTGKRGVLQAKTVAPGAFKRSWTDTATPLWIALQTATEMMLTDAFFGVTAALIIDAFNPKLELYDVPRLASVEDKIRDGVEAFWNLVDFGEEPDPNYALDADLLAKLAPEIQPLKRIDLTNDNHLPILLDERAQLKRQMRSAEARCEEIETELRDKMEDAGLATISGFIVTHKTIEVDGYTVAPKRYRKLHIKDMRDDREDGDGQSTGF